MQNPASAGTTSKRRRWGRVAGLFAWIAAALVIAGIAAALVLPLFLDTPAVKAELQRKLSEAVQGEVAWEDLSIRVLPSPRGIMRKARIEIPAILEVKAEQLAVRPAFWPLLRGRVEIASVDLSRPAIRLDIAAAPDDRGEARAKAGEPEPDLAATWRSTVGGIAGIVRRYAPDTVLSVEGAQLEFSAPGILPIALHDVTVRAQSGRSGMDLDASLAGTHWSRVKLSARLQFADLSGHADVEFSGLKLQTWLDHYLAKSPIRVAVPASDLHFRASIDGKTELDGGFELRTAFLELVRDARRVRVPDLRVKGKIEAREGGIRVSLDDVGLGVGRLAGGTLHYLARSGVATLHARFDLDTAQTMEIARSLTPVAAAQALERFQAEGRAQGSVSADLGRADWSVAVDVVKSNVTVKVRDLPGPAGFTGGSARISRKGISIDRAALSLLDATATASATISDSREGLSVRGSIAEGTIGEEFLDWIWQMAQVPPRWMLKTPVRIAVPSFAWGPKQALDVQATARFDPGPSVAVGLGWTPAALEVRRAAIKDERSNTVMTARIAGSRLEGTFSGSLSLSSLAAMLKSAPVRGGRISGTFRMAIDREDARRNSAEGSLKGEALDLAWLVGQPVKIETIGLAVEGDTLRIGDATGDWAGQRATLRGEIRRSEGPPVIDAQLDSPGLDLDALRKMVAGAAVAKPAAAAAPSKLPPDAAYKLPEIWPLPVTGRIEVRSAFVQSGRYKVAPLAATLVLEERRAHMDLTQAELCGISLPLVLEATPQGYSVSARITAKKQQLEQTAQCLTGAEVLISGLYDLKVDISTQGEPAELLGNLKGAIRADIQNGKVMKFALLGNILSMGNVTALLEKEGTRLDDTAFPYRSITVSGRYEQGRFIVEESAFRSDAMGLAAAGWISLLDYETRLTVLVAPFGRFDQWARKMPILGYVIGGAFTSLPVGVSGDIRDPRVVPLGPGAITSDLLGIFERTMKLPAKLITVPEGGTGEKPKQE
jgi:uncharacterized protein involved in outer membrane biogenesis